MAETQEIRYKKETITTFRIPLTPSCPKSFQNPTNDVALSFFCDDTFSYQVLPIKYDASSSLLPFRIFFWLPLSYS